MRSRLRSSPVRGGASKPIVNRPFDWSPSPKRSLPAESLTVSPTDGEMRFPRSEEHTSELQSQSNLVCRLLLEKKSAPDDALDDFEQDRGEHGQAVADQRVLEGALGLVDLRGVATGGGLVSPAPNAETGRPRAE